MEIEKPFEQMNEVVERSLKGYTPTQIAKELDIKRNEVLRIIDEWKSYAQNDKSIQERAREALVASDQHYSMLMNKAWETVEQSDNAADLRSKVSALKLVAEIQARQMDMLQKAGLLDNTEMGSKIAETEEKLEVLMGILRDVTSKCEKCQREVKQRLSRISGVVEPVEIIQVNNG
jgi:transcriptional regulator